MCFLWFLSFDKFGDTGRILVYGLSTCFVFWMVQTELRYTIEHAMWAVFFLFSTVSLPHQRPSTWNVEKAQIDGWMKCCCVVDRLFSPGKISKLIFWSNGFTSSDEFYGDIQGDLLCLSWVAAGQLYQATWWIFPNWPSLRNSRLVRYWNRTHKWMSVCMYRYIVVVIYIYIHICLGVYFFATCAFHWSLSTTPLGSWAFCTPWNQFPSCFCCLPEVC